MKPKDETRGRPKYGKVQVWARVDAQDANNSRTSFASFRSLAVVHPDGSAVWVLGVESFDPCFAEGSKSQRETVRRGRRYCKSRDGFAVYLGDL